MLHHFSNLAVCLEHSLEELQCWSWEKMNFVERIHFHLPNRENITEFLYETADFHKCPVSFAEWVVTSNSKSFSNIAKLLWLTFLFQFCILSKNPHKIILNCKLVVHHTMNYFSSIVIWKPDLDPSISFAGDPSMHTPQLCLPAGLAPQYILKYCPSHLELGCSFQIPVQRFPLSRSNKYQ